MPGMRFSTSPIVWSCFWANDGHRICYRVALLADTVGLDRHNRSVWGVELVGITGPEGLTTDYLRVYASSKFGMEPLQS